MTVWVYIHSEAGLWTVGFYDPTGKWHPESDYEHREQAAARVHYLNGGNGPAELVGFTTVGSGGRVPPL